MSDLMDLADRWIMTPFMFLLVGVLGLGIFIGIPYGLYKWATYVPPETFSLRVDSWRCTATHEQEREMCAKGCRRIRETVCDQWSAR